VAYYCYYPIPSAFQRSTAFSHAVRLIASTPYHKLISPYCSRRSDCMAIRACDRAWKQSTNSPTRVGKACPVASICHLSCKYKYLETYLNLSDRRRGMAFTLLSLLQKHILKYITNIYSEGLLSNANKWRLGYLCIILMVYHPVSNGP